MTLLRAFGLLRAPSPPSRDCWEKAKYKIGAATGPMNFARGQKVFIKEETHASKLKNVEELAAWKKERSGRCGVAPKWEQTTAKPDVIIPKRTRENHVSKPFQTMRRICLCGVVRGGGLLRSDCNGNPSKRPPSSLHSGTRLPNLRQNNSYISRDPRPRFFLSLRFTTAATASSTTIGRRCCRRRTYRTSPSRTSGV